MRRQTRGVTLLEVLVVIAVIGIVLGLLIPAVVRTRQRARNIECLNNLRQLSLGFRLHAESRGGRFPSGTRKPWFVEIAPHLQATEGVFQCPDDPGQTPLSYGWRDDLATVPEACLAGKKIDRAATSQLVLVFDQSPGWHEPDMINVGTVGGAAMSLDEQAFEDNLMFSVDTGDFFFLDGS